MSNAELLTDPVLSAKDAGLHYVSDAKPGIVRKRCGKGFRYIDPEGATIKDPAILTRIKSLAIPPAWKQVWICPNPRGHLQAVGRDAKGRKQSRYHPRWREVRDATKYERMLLFGAALPAIRERVAHDLALPEMPREKVLATIVQLMEKTLIRVGNVEYAQENHSYGLTTMRGRHVHVDGSTVTFKFQGKSGIRHTVDIHDRRIARIVQRCQDIPGYELFQYIDSDGNHHTVDSADVNDYLREISHEDFTAKDFRTWAGTLLASAALKECEACDSETQAKKNIVQAVKSVAAQLRNTPAVCRKCYVHPAILESYLDGTLLKEKTSRSARNGGSSESALRAEESGLLDLLKRHQKK